MHEFWNKQPVPQDKVIFKNDGEINPSRELRYEKNPLPEGYEWSSCTVDELCEFLKDNYITSIPLPLAISKLSAWRMPKSPLVTTPGILLIFCSNDMGSIISKS